MNDDFHNSLLASWLKKQIRRDPIWNRRLKLLANCMTYGDLHGGVQVVSNNTDTRILGVRPCLHAWACPECTAKKMSKYSTRIAAAIDALYKKDLVPIMITYTVFHTIQQDCEQTYKLLLKSWNNFDKNKTWRRKKKTPTKKIQSNHVEGDYYIKASPWGEFYNEFHCNHTVKTLEITYGKHGWHPHIHQLVWIPKSKLQKTAEFEQRLQEFWNKCVDNAAKIIFDEKHYETRKFLESKPTREDYNHQGLYISKTETGKIKAWSSGDYLCGWGGNNELTGLGMKIAHGENVTPFQMLEKSYDLELKHPEHSKYLLDKYFEFAYTVIKNRISRVQFSRTGLKSIIDTHLQTEEFKSILKKKKEKLNIKPYHNVAWFTSKQWHDICYSDNPYLIPLIKRFATYEDDPIFGVGAFELISELMIVNGLDPPAWIASPTTDFAEWFNKKIAA